MFESMIARAVKPKDVNWTNPKYMDILLEDDEEQKYRSYIINKGADNFLHKQLTLKPNTSKEVYKKSESIWRDLKNYLLEKAKEDPNEYSRFTLLKDTVLYLIDENKNLIDVTDTKTEDVKEEFLEKLEKFKIDITTMDKTRKFYAEGKNGVIKLVCYDKNIDVTKQTYTPIVAIEFNNKKSQYIVHTGILVYNGFTYVPSVSSFLEDDCLSDFINHVSIDDALAYATEQAEGLYNDYLSFKENPIEISVRELISLLKKIGCKLELKTDDQLDSINALSDDANNTRIQEFFNTFTLTTGETAFDILALSELKKIFRYNKLTLLEVLTILSKEYISYDCKVTMDILSSIIYSLYDKKVDKNQAESIKYEIKKD